MGYRTVVSFNNDLSTAWCKDPTLGDKIARDMFKDHESSNGRISELERIGGNVLECVHADTLSLVIYDGYTGKVEAQTFWSRNKTNEDHREELLRIFANKLGFNIVKKKGKTSENKL